FVASWSDVGGADASARQKDHLGAHARACELVEPGGDLLFDHPAESADAERFRDFGRGPSAFGVVRTIEQPNSEAVCVEVHSTRLAELAKACIAALLSSLRCLILLCQIGPVPPDMAYFSANTPHFRPRFSRLSLKPGGPHLSDKIVLRQKARVTT